MINKITLRDENNQNNPMNKKQNRMSGFKEFKFNLNLNLDHVQAKFKNSFFNPLFEKPHNVF